MLKVNIQDELCYFHENVISSLKLLVLSESVMIMVVAIFVHSSQCFLLQLHGPLYFSYVERSPVSSPGSDICPTPVPCITL